MRTFVGVTDIGWARFLEARPYLDEVNFWLPSANVGFAALQPGERFLFKTHAPENLLVGGGFYEAYVALRVSEAWAFFGEGNGVLGPDALKAATGRYATRIEAGTADPTIGCVILRDVTWFGSWSVPAPTSFARNIVRGKTYREGDDSVVDAMTARLIEAPTTNGVEAAAASLGAVFGEPRLTVPRLHQGAFRAVVLDAYESRCAITGHRIRPTLQAAHIRPVTSGGEHRIDNGLLLRSDIHTLFDRGYLTVDPRYRLRVSPRLRDEFGNGEDLYRQAASAEPIAVPRRQRDRPSPTELEWHGDTVFLAS